MSDADEERIIADMRGRLRRRALLIVLTSLAVIATEFVLVMGFHMITLPLRWQSIALVTAIAALVAVVGVTATYWATRLPPEALSTRITLRHSDRVQRILSRLYLFYPFILGVFAFNSVGIAHRVLHQGWRIPDVIGSASFLVNVALYVLLLTGWGVGRMSRLIYEDELFRSFRTRGYIAGFWSVLAGLLLILALGLTRPAWAVEALPVLIAVGVSVPAATIALLNRRAERDA
jgi:hypothetical protein